MMRQKHFWPKEFGCLLIPCALFVFLFIVFLFIAPRPTFWIKLFDGSFFLFVAAFFFAWYCSMIRRQLFLLQIVTGIILILIFVFGGFAGKDPWRRDYVLGGGLLFSIPGVVLLLVGWFRAERSARILSWLLRVYAGTEIVNLDREAHRLRLKESYVHEEYRKASEAGRLQLEMKVTDDSELLTDLRRLCQAYIDGNESTIARLERKATEIGQELNRIGGIAEMRRVFEKLKGQTGARTLESHWDGIGEWRG